MINIFITNDATKVLFIVISKLTRGRNVSQRYYVFIFIMQKNPPMCKRRIVIAQKFVIFCPNNFFEHRKLFHLQSSRPKFCHVVFQT